MKKWFMLFPAILAFVGVADAYSAPVSLQAPAYAQCQETASENPNQLLFVSCGGFLE